MSLICRLISHKGTFLLNCSKRLEIFRLARHIQIKASPYRPPPKESHDEKNMRIGRPMSPHLQIYATQLTSALSALHRITGFAIGGYVILLAFGSLVLPGPLSGYVDTIDGLGLGLVPLSIIKSVLALPFCYHVCNGVRHLVWDATAQFLTLKGVYSTGYAMLMCVVATTAALVVCL